jgi:CBS domain containing-hemolysin-like protein
VAGSLVVDKFLRRLKRYGITLPFIFNDQGDLRKLVDQAGERSIIADSQREMIQSVLDLGETLVRELMVPRTDIVWIEGNRTLRQGLSLALRSEPSGYTSITIRNRARVSRSICDQPLLYLKLRLQPIF